jgi:hypothetical protein
MNRRKGGPSVFLTFFDKILRSLFKKKLKTKKMNDFKFIIDSQRNKFLFSNS